MKISPLPPRAHYLGWLRLVGKKSFPWNLRRQTPFKVNRVVLNKNSKVYFDKITVPRFRVSSRVPLARLLFKIFPKWRAFSLANKADTTRLWSRTQNISFCFLTSISAVILKLTVQITSVFYKRYSLPSKFIVKSISWLRKRPVKQPGQAYDGFVYTLPRYWATAFAYAGRERYLWPRQDQPSLNWRSVVRVAARCTCDQFINSLRSLTAARSEIKKSDYYGYNAVSVGSIV